MASRQSDDRQRTDQIVALEKALSAVEEERDRLAEALRNLVTSRSWRLTEPFRAVVAIARRLLRREEQRSPAVERPAIVDESDLFDAEYYLEVNPDVDRSGVDPWHHFREWGASEGRCPHPLFDTAYYQAATPELLFSGENPLVHFLQSGWREGRDPHPLFDTAFYLEFNEVGALSIVDPVTHYLRWGAGMGFDPSPFFHTRHYLEGNPDVAASNVNPLTHYVRWGIHEGRSPVPR